MVTSFRRYLLTQFLSIFLLWVGGCSVTVAMQAQRVPSYDETQYDAVINHLYQTIPNSLSQNLYQRILADSAYFLNRDYQLFANGEGKNGIYDQQPLYHTDKFDCLTYVSTIIALAKANDLSQFKSNMRALGYENGKVDFTTRNHFTSVDYNINNQNNGFLTDITKTIVDKKGRPVYVLRQTTVDKAVWFKQLRPTRLSSLTPLSKQQENTLLNQLRDAGKNAPAKTIAFAYIPLSTLFSPTGQANLDLFNQIPSGTVVEVVRPIEVVNSPNKNILPVGSGVDVTHLGFVIKTPKGLMFREASSIENKVIDVPLIAYLRGYFMQSNVLGIHLEKVN